MKRSNPRFRNLSFVILVLAGTLTVQSLALSRSNHRPAGSALVQYDDPYSVFRNARYSNSGLLNERDEVKLGTQLHREVTRKFRVTDVGLDRVERLGQQGHGGRGLGSASEQQEIPR